MMCVYVQNRDSKMGVSGFEVPIIPHIIGPTCNI